MAFDHSRQRWFGTCSCKPAPRGLPSSEKQLRATWPYGPFALVAHNNGQTALTACCSDRSRHAAADRWIWQSRPLRIKCKILVGLRDPDSSPFALALLVGRRVSWFSPLVHEGKAATIC